MKSHQKLKGTSVRGICRDVKSLDRLHDPGTSIVYYCHEVSRQPLRLPSLFPPDASLNDLFQQAAEMPNLAGDPGKTAILRLENVFLDRMTGMIFTEQELFCDLLIGQDPTRPFDEELSLFDHHQLSSPDNAFIIDRFDRGREREPEVFISSERFSSAVQVDEPLLLLRSDGNYYHWLLFSLSTNLWLRNMLGGFDVKFVVQGNTAGFIDESLDYYGFDRRRFYAGDARVLFCRVLYTSFPLCPTLVPAPLVFNLLTSHSDLRQPPAEPAAEIIYVSRKDSGVRRVSNEDEIIENLRRRWDVRVVQATSLPFSEQVRTFRNASLVVGPHGAGLANALFSPRAKILEFSQLRWHPGMWYISAVRRLDHYVVLAASEYHDRSAIIANPSWRRGSYPSLLRMDVNEVVTAVEAALSEGPAQG